MIFADTSALVALFNNKDENHQRALEWFKQLRPKMIITDYIIDELLTLSLSRGNKQFAITISKNIKNIFPSDSIKKITTEEFQESWDIFEKFLDKNWSFTDCTSYVFMKKFNFRKAFTFDKHFKEFGFVEIFPQ